MADGYSAASVAVAGRSVIGRKQYGIYRLLTIDCEATQKKMLDISQINSLTEVIGLQYNMDYSTEDHLKSLRYGKLVILTDQNENGSHFKGLLINFLYTNWPHLVRLPFLEEFITPVVKATKGEDKYSFFSFAEFDEWKASTPDNNTYNVKYYLGLGTMSWIEAKEYFSNIDSHRVMFKYNGPEDDQNISKAFSKNAMEQRKEWLTEHMDDCRRRKAIGLQDKYLYTGKTKAVSFSEFINSEYVLFANFDNAWSIPSVVDGLKPGQRKVLYTCNKHNDKRKIRVNQLAGSIAEVAAYHHCERSLCKIIIDMAQSYIGSNNINLLIPFGQFGTRLMGGKDCADYYYLYTMRSTLTRLIFHPHDDPLLSYNTDRIENQKIEPNWYIPIIPMILVNGFEGTGTGWSTKVPKYDTHQLIRSLRKMIAGEEPEVLTPHYNHFLGSIEATGDTRFAASGCVAIIESGKIEITELPIGTWTTPYKENVLEPLLHGTENVKPIITEYKEYHTDTTVRFVISFAPGEFEKLEKEVGGFHRVFKLCGSINTNNMHAFDSNNYLRKYEKANDILKEFYNVRLEYYVKRKNYWEIKLTAEADKLCNQAKFIMEKTNNTLVVENKTQKVMIDELIELGYLADPVEKWRRKTGIDANEKEGEKEGEDCERALSKELINFKEYDYLLGMSMWMLTEESKNELFKQRDAKISELNVLKKKSEYDLWLTDLDALENALLEMEEKQQNEQAMNSNKDLYPSETGKNVVFKVTEAFLEKYCKDEEE